MNQDSKSVSIVVPMHNVANYIRKCLDSLISQTLHDIEIICVDDGSSDDSAAIAESYSENDSRIKVIRRAQDWRRHMPRKTLPTIFSTRWPGGRACGLYGMIS